MQKLESEINNFFIRNNYKNEMAKRMGTKYRKAKNVSCQEKK